MAPSVKRAERITPYRQTFSFDFSRQKPDEQGRGGAFKLGGLLVTSIPADGHCPGHDEGLLTRQLFPPDGIIA